MDRSVSEAPGESRWEHSLPHLAAFFEKESNVIGCRGSALRTNIQESGANLGEGVTTPHRLAQLAPGASEAQRMFTADRSRRRY
jgi:hypothetical protein